METIKSRKDETLSNLESKNKEVINELEMASHVREKLNEHIIYLQNEVRKRDELLEGDSDFGGDDDFALASDSAPDETSSKGDAIRSSTTKNGD